MPTLSNIAAHHVAFSVPDLEQAVSFWREHFGLEVNHRMQIPAAGILGAFVGGSGILLELWQAQGSSRLANKRRTPSGDLKTQGTKHLAIRVADVQDAIDLLFDAGVQIVAVQRGFGLPMQAEVDPTTAMDGRPRAVACFISEPSGALVEIIGKTDFD